MPLVLFTMENIYEHFKGVHKQTGTSSSTLNNTKEIKLN